MNVGALLFVPVMIVALNDPSLHAKGPIVWSPEKVPRGTVSYCHPLLASSEYEKPTIAAPRGQVTAGGKAPPAPPIVLKAPVPLTVKTTRSSVPPQAATTDEYGGSFTCEAPYAAPTGQEGGMTMGVHTGDQPQSVLGITYGAEPTAYLGSGVVPMPVPANTVAI